MAVKIIKPGATGVSFGGESFKAGKDGWIEVPEEAVAELLSHGFSTTLEGAAAAEPSYAEMREKLKEALAVIEEARAQFQPLKEHLVEVETRCAGLQAERDQFAARVAELEEQLADAQKAKKK